MERVIVVVVAAVAFNMALSLLWYYPKLLGAIWLRAYSFESAVLLKPKLVQYIGTFLVSFVLAIVVAVLISLFNVTTLEDGIKLGSLLWLGFIATTEFSSVIWEKKPISGYLIDAGYWLVSLLVITPAIAMWH